MTVCIRKFFFSVISQLVSDPLKIDRMADKENYCFSC